MNDIGTSKSDLSISHAMGDYGVNLVKFGNLNGFRFTGNNQMVMCITNTPHLGSVPDEALLEVLDRYFKWKLGL